MRPVLLRQGEPGTPQYIWAYFQLSKAQNSVKDSFYTCGQILVKFVITQPKNLNVSFF